MGSPPFFMFVEFFGLFGLIQLFENKMWNTFQQRTAEPNHGKANRIY
jgi:hypothetical protein